jgi:hypothetical protein
MRLTAKFAGRLENFGNNPKRARFRGRNLALLVTLLLATSPAGAAEIISITLANLTTGAWGDAVAPEPDVGALVSNYTDTNGWIFPTLNPNGQHQYRSQATGSHGSLEFDTRASRQ